MAHLELPLTVKSVPSATVLPSTFHTFSYLSKMCAFSATDLPSIPTVSVINMLLAEKVRGLSLKLLT